MASLSPEVERLLAAAPSLPLTQEGLVRNSASRLDSSSAESLFRQAPHAQAALAGLLLRLGHWSESHDIAQDVSSTEGSYWHAILHRMEPDPSNAGYWFRRVGRHAIFPKLLEQAREILANYSSIHWKLKQEWDPMLFVAWCEEASRKRGETETAARAIQMAEWQLLFEWCAVPTE
jgi:hypothetical protein